MQRLFLVWIGMLALGAALPQRPPYQPGPWVYPLPTSEPPLPVPSPTKESTVSNVIPQNLKPVAAAAAVELEAAAVASQETTLKPAAEKEREENLDEDPQQQGQVTPEVAPATTMGAPEINSSQRYDILGVAIAPAVIDRTKFRPIKDMMYW